MLSKLLEMIERLPDEVFFYLEDGPLKHKLIARYRDQADAHGELLELEHNLSLKFRRGARAATPTFDARLEADDFLYQTSFVAEDFSAAEIAELLERLGLYAARPRRQGSQPAKNILRKQKGRDLLNIAAAARTLGLSHRRLKSLIPCSETRIVAEAGGQGIKEFYWERALVDRFAGLWVRHQQGRGYNSEDLELVAANCCDGDRRWAHDCITGFLAQCRLRESRTPQGDAGGAA